MIYTIPLPTGVPWFDLRVSLDAREYVISLQWNARAATWCIAIGDRSGALIVTRKLTLGYPLLTGVIDPRRPAGELLAAARFGVGPAGIGDLGHRVVLAYAGVS